MEFKIKIGDKCKIPKTKEGQVSGFYSPVLNLANQKKQDYLYYNGVSCLSNSHMLNDEFNPKNLTGDFFAEHEIELYEEEFPEKWCIRQNASREVCDWFNQKYGINSFVNGDYTYLVNWETPENGNYSFRVPKNTTEITLEQFKKHILKESTTMKNNLLETEFVIENCTLSQRLAIKAYCDEKNIKYASKYTFEDKVFDALVWDKTEFLNYETGRKDKRDRVTFSELIQFLDQYQPEPEFKADDFVLLKDDAGGYGGYDIISKQIVKILEITNKGSKREYIRFIFNGENNTTIVEKIERHATPEEIKKWKEENEIKLPRINQYDGKVSGDFIIYGNNCAKLKISWFKNIGDISSFLNIGENRTIRSIKLNSDVEITIAHIEQIKKFIEFNKL